MNTSLQIASLAKTSSAKIIDGMQHEHKAVTVQGIVDVLSRRGWYEAVRARVSEAARASLEAPQRSKYHPGSVIDETTAVIYELHGPQAVERVMYELTEGALAGVIGPLAKMFMTLSRSGPLVLLERFETLTQGGGRGFAAKWSPNEPKAGHLLITTDAVTPNATDFAWKGTVEYLLVFAQVKGEVEIMPRQLEGRSVHLRLRWQ